jgi:hypothetical protein
VAQRIYVLTNHGKTLRIRAERFNHGIGGQEVIAFYQSKESRDPDGQISVSRPYEIFAEEMLFDTFGDTLIDPFVDTAGEKDFKDALFSEEEKRPFTLEERGLIVQALADAKGAIKEKFQTSEQQQRDVDQKLDYLMRKVAELDRFNWKRLFVSTLVGLSVDLLFGTMIPSSLVDVFKQVFSRLVEGKKLFSDEKLKLK